MRYTLSLFVGALLASTTHAQTLAPPEPANPPEVAPASAAAAAPGQPAAPDPIPDPRVAPATPIAPVPVPPEAIQAPAPAPSAMPTPATAAPAGEKEKVVEEIVVTGSRIKRKELTTPAPVTVLTKDTIMASGKINVGDFLQTLPEQAGGVNGQINNGNDGSVTVNLRQLGEQRTLVLVNGRRMVAGGTDPGARPDLNSIPTVAIERIEVLKDGASALYGSDAIGGVVNIITKKRFTGSEASVFAGQSGYGDGTAFDISGSVGTASETSSILFSVAYQTQAGVRASARPWAPNTRSYNFQTGEMGISSGNSPTSPDGMLSIPDIEKNCANAALRAARPALNDVCQLYATNGKTNNFVPGGYAADGSSLYSTYDKSLYNTYPTNYISIPNHRLQMFATGNAQLGSEARAFFEASYVNRYSQNNMAPMPLVSNSAKPILVSKDSMYNPFGVDIRDWRHRTEEFGNRTWSDLLDTFRVVTGLDGELGNWAGPLHGWNWEVSFNYGRTGGTEVNDGQLRTDTIANATGPSMLDNNGNPICVSVAGDPSTKIPGCVPGDVLHGAGTLLPSMKSYMGSVGVLKAVNEQKVLSLNLGGDLFRILSRRPVGLAVGYDFRSEYAEQIPDPITAAGQTSGNMKQPTSGSFNVNEGYLELSIPVIGNRFLADDLELSLAGRAVKYNMFKGNQSYKIGAMYSPFRDISLRGTFSTAFRAPSINELYGGSGMSADFARDPCNGPSRPATCAADSRDGALQYDTLKGANPNLTPETAKIFTAGVVVGPRAVPNLSVTLDYYNVKINNTIDYLTAAYIIAKCYEDGDQSMCERITRDSNYKIINVDDQRRNYGIATASGIDLALRYRFPVETYGRFGFTFDGTYLIESNTTDATGFVTKSAGNYDSFILTPRVKFNAGLSWALGGFGVNLISRVIGSFEECGSGNSICSIDDSDKRLVPAFASFDGNMIYSFKSTAGRTSLMLGVQNLFNADPPFLANANNYGADPDYPALGRYFYARVTQSL